MPSDSRAALRLPMLLLLNLPNSLLDDISLLNHSVIKYNPVCETHERQKEEKIELLKTNVEGNTHTHTLLLLLLLKPGCHKGHATPEGSQSQSVRSRNGDGVASHCRDGNDNSSGHTQTQRPLSQRPTLSCRESNGDGQSQFAT